MKKEGDNSFGVASVVLGILSIVIGFMSSPYAGVVLGVMGIVFSRKQHAIESNKWSKNGKILSIIGIIVSVVVIIIAAVAFSYFASNPSFLSELQSYQ